MREKQPMFNGMSCLAAQMVAHFKKGVGGFYLYRGGTTDCGEVYHYEVIWDEEELTMRCIEVGWDKVKDKVLFEGTPQEFLESALVKESV